MERLRRQGYLVSRAETWVPLPDDPRGGVRRDLFYIADVIAIHPRERIVLLVQATSVDNISARVSKIRHRPEAVKLLAAGIRVEVWGWTKRAGKWQPKIVSIQPDSLEPIIVQRIPRRPRKALQPDLFAGMQP
jgi:hypothetical protein